MVLPLDHIVIAVCDLDQAIRDYAALGFTVLRGGVHANRATHNALIVFRDGVYLELLAATGEPPLPDLIDFARMLTNGAGLAGFALRTPDIEAEKRRLAAAGITVSEIIPGAREKNGRVMRWKLALLDAGFAPFLIEDVTPRAWRVPGDAAVITHANHAVGVAAVEIKVQELAAAAARYARLLDHTAETAGAGPVRLTENSLLTSPIPGETLAALHLTFTTAPTADFALALTHGVQIMPSSTP